MQEERPRVNRTTTHDGAPIFPNMRVDIMRSVGKEPSTIKFYSIVRVADDEGNHYFSPVRNEYSFDISLDNRGRFEQEVIKLSKQINDCTTAFTFNCYAKIMCGKPDMGLVNPTTNKNEYQLDNNNQNERERMFEVMHPLQAAAERSRKDINEMDVFPQFSAAGHMNKFFK